jgi:hypothetical protein
MRQVIKEHLNGQIIRTLSKKWIQWYKENDGITPEEINTGECMNYAECLSHDLDEHHIAHEILSDGLFFDPFGDEDPELLANPQDYGSTPTYDYMTVGLPSHYWLYINGKHYDSECIEGVDNFFHLPTIEKFKRKYVKD